MSIHHFIPMPMATGHGKITATRSLSNVKYVTFWRGMDVGVILHIIVQVLLAGMETVALEPIVIGPYDAEFVFGGS